MSGRRHILLVASACCALAVVPQAAGAKIFVNRGIGSVRLGDSQVQVQRSLGKPSSKQAPDWIYRRRGLAVGLSHGLVVDIRTTGRGERTARGVARGSPLAEFRRAYPKAKCFHVRSGPGVICMLSSSFRGRPVETDFLFSGRLRQTDIFVQGVSAKSLPAGALKNTTGSGRVVKRPATTPPGASPPTTETPWGAIAAAVTLLVVGAGAA
jgi:hypothetical protein